MSGASQLAADAAASLDLVAITDRPDKQRYLIAEAWETARRALELLDADNLSGSTVTGREEAITQAAEATPPSPPGYDSGSDRGVDGEGPYESFAIGEVKRFMTAMINQGIEVDGEGVYGASGIADDIVEDLLDSGVLIPSDLTWHDLASRFPQLREECTYKAFPRMNGKSEAIRAFRNSLALAWSAGHRAGGCDAEGIDVTPNPYETEGR